MSEDNRPEWDFELSENQVRQLSSHIKKITHHWKFTGADTSRNWMEFHTDSGTFIAPNGWDKLFQFRDDHAGLIQPNYTGDRAVQRLREIDAWEERNKRDRAEFERLKKKFGN